MGEVSLTGGELLGSSFTDKPILSRFMTPNSGISGIIQFSLQAAPLQSLLSPPIAYTTLHNLTVGSHGSCNFLSFLGLVSFMSFLIKLQCFPELLPPSGRECFNSEKVAT